VLKDTMNGHAAPPCNALQPVFGSTGSAAG